MARSLYRLYLYVLFTLMTLFGALSLSFMLSQLFEYTPLNGGETFGQNNTSLTQASAFAVIALIVSGALGGLHYWLIRREQSADPEPGKSVIRALFLNAPEAYYALSLVSTLSFALFVFEPGGSADISFAIGYSISATLIVILLELERRRIPATTGAAGVFQRLHFYGVQLILLFIIQGFLQYALGVSERALLQNTSFNLCAPGEFGELPFSCGVTNFGSLWLAALVPILAWGAYAQLTRNDQRSAIRQVFHVLGLSYGVIVFIIGVERALEYILRAPFGQPTDPITFGVSYDFPPMLIFSGLTILAYGMMLRAAAAQSPAGPTTLGLIVQSLVAAFLAVPFWLGLAALVYNVIEGAAKGTLTSDTSAWPSTLALLLIGLAYIPTALNLSRRSFQTQVHGPRRGFVLALLAGGALTVAGSIVALLFALVTAALNVPLPNWQDLARAAASALIVGLALGGVYVWIAIREGVFARQPAPVAPAAPAASAPSVASVVPTTTTAPTMPESSEPMTTPTANGASALATPGAVESVLDALLANTLTRDQAAARIRELAGATLN